MDNRLMNEYRRQLLARPAPCEDCKHNTKCALDLKACRVFQYFVSTGSFLPNTERTPTRKIYNEIFYEDEPNFTDAAEERRRLRRQFRLEVL